MIDKELLEVQEDKEIFLKVSSDDEIDLTAKEEIELHMMVQDEDVIKLTFNEGATFVVDHEVYHGATEVTPKRLEQILNTADKVVRQNVTIHEIPSYQVRNPQGGYTYIIGE